ncbi:DNA topoisomerase III, putative [Ixodes scapularis]|uniref:DNA topoisomerase n=1 Tax=Ixodes scapularis TaxID=6945 RepID=B7PYY7_IXOSC|nr:DNA topoisomerase III, putative [Ixodes scapularis]|eukprot:XP_002404244.1 DNA topoisomerase III, putative [Ixodes scapularis]
MTSTATLRRLQSSLRRCLLLAKRASSKNVSLRQASQNSKDQEFKPGMRVLNVAEKNDAAKNLSEIMSRGSYRRRDGLSVYNKIYEFDYNLFNTNCKMVMTSVSGHLLTLEFVSDYRKWHSCSPVELFHAPVIMSCGDKNYEKIKETLEKEIRYCDALVIWTDCDREGENIGFQIISVCRKVKPRVRVYRARFSEITPQAVARACQNLADPDPKLNAAVEVRRELDLRIGAAFTRLQTLRLKREFPQQLHDRLVSYGSCQFPTLGFVVERYRQILNFVPEPFWKIHLTHKKDDILADFSWKRHRLFDYQLCFLLYQRCLQGEVSVVVEMKCKPKSKWRPQPMDTVVSGEAPFYLGASSLSNCWRVLRNPGTSDQLPGSRTTCGMIRRLRHLTRNVLTSALSSAPADFARRLLADGLTPRQGTKSDQAHPPIHPIKHAASLEFVATGLIIFARNYLDVYPYDKWSAKEIPNYEMNETFVPDQLKLVDGETSPPPLLKEADLIALMEKHGIGTDATHADHIETVKNRLYVALTGDGYLVPGELGMGLVEGYDSMGLEMSKPRLRAELEADLKKICDGTKNPKDVLRRQIELYEDVFSNSERQIKKLGESLKKYLGTGQRLAPPANGPRSNRTDQSRPGGGGDSTNAGASNRRGGRRCGLCNQEGHNRRNCPNR